MKYLLSLLLSLAAATVLAATATVTATWSIPTTREDGSTITAADISGYELTYSIDGGKPVAISVGGSSTAAKDVILQLAGRATPYATSWTIVAIDSTGLRSKPSTAAKVSITVPQSPISAPSAVSVKVSCANGVCSVSAAAQ
jgi:hypothetical protein